MYFGSNLAYLRILENKTQDMVASELGLSRSAISLYEIGKREPSLSELIRIARYYKVSIDDLLTKDMRPLTPVYVNNLRYLRKKHNITQTELAKVLGFKGKQSICAIETGAVDISVDNLIKLADYFNVTLDQLVKQDLSKEAKRL